MRTTLLMTVAMMGLASTAALAQIGSTQTPPSPTASSQMPQPANSAPVGATTGVVAAPGANVGGVVTAPRAPMATTMPDGGRRPMGRVARAPMRSRQAIPAQTNPGAVDDQAAPPTAAYRGGVGSPLSQHATNLSPSRPETMGSRLPDPNAAGNSPRELLAAAQRALNQGKTGAAQEALERAETRVLSRTTDPSMANQPDSAGMVQNISQARRALGARDINGAKQAISMAMDERVPPRGPATTTVPGGAPVGTTY